MEDYDCTWDDWHMLKKSELMDFIFITTLFSDEQERVQKKTFVNWINSYLMKVSWLIYSFVGK